MTRKIATALFIVFLMSVWSAFASYTIWTPNSVQDIVTEYALSPIVKDTPSGNKYTNFTLTTTLTFGGVGISGNTVLFYRSLDNATWTQIGSNTTGTTGLAAFTVNRTEVGEFYYKGAFAAP